MDKKSNNFLEDNFELNDIKPTTKKTVKKEPVKKEPVRNTTNIDFNHFFTNCKEFIFKHKTIILSSIAIIIILIAVFSIISNLINYNQNKEELEVTKDTIPYTDTVETTDKPAETAVPATEPPAISVETQPPTEAKSEINKKQFENIRLRYNNDDIMGYILAFGTNINAPVAIAENNTFYQDHDLYKNENIDGALFLDSSTDVSNLSKNTIIYGRCDIPSEQFYDLALYKDEKYYRENRFITFDTPYNNTVWEIFSFHLVNDDYSYLKTSFTDQKEFETFIVGLKNLSMYEIDTSVTKDDKILTLTSTNTNNERYVIHAKLYRMN